MNDKEKLCLCRRERDAYAVLAQDAEKRIAELVKANAEVASLNADYSQRIAELQIKLKGQTSLANFYRQWIKDAGHPIPGPHPHQDSTEGGGNE
jgi:hypothetical protein